MKKRADKPKLKLPWNEVLKALQTTHTLSIRDVCKILKTSRNWVNAHISPHCEQIYLSQKWVQLASKQLQEEIKDMVWFKDEDFYNLINNSISTVTAQTKSVPIDYFLNSESKKQFYEKYKATVKSGDFLTYDEIFKMAESFADEEERKLFETRADQHNRSDYLRVAVELPDNYDLLKNWFPPHARRDYGDTDEMLYRDFFNRGFWRIELKINHEDKKPGEKIFYIEDPHYLGDGVGQNVPIPYNVYVRDQSKYNPIYSYEDYLQEI